LHGSNLVLLYWVEQILWRSGRQNSIISQVEYKANLSYEYNWGVLFFPSFLLITFSHAGETTAMTKVSFTDIGLQNKNF